MNTIMSQKKALYVGTPAGFSELVRGNEDRLMALLTPVVREQNAVLDLGGVRRIDAAGVAALISIYGIARATGHSFRVCNVTSHVAEILELVSLDHILVAQERVEAQPVEPCVECPAA
ncbi:MAG TPA: STAS domain-containing protein [Terracidiphilus sp.]